MADNPVLVNLWRGSALESRHRGAVAVVDAAGKLVFSLGDVYRPEFPRSAIKFLQAIPLVESGAVEQFQLENRHIALACASHNGETVHTELVSSWLEKIGCSVDDLECGAEMPLDPQTQFDMMGRGEVPKRHHHNCSGKHAGLLATCRAYDEPTTDYRLYTHAAQRRWFNVLQDLTRVEVATLGWGYDGCGIPSLALPLQRLAQALGRFADPVGLPLERAEAIERVLEAVSAEPYMVAGRDRLCSDLMALTGREVLVKIGAEGMYIAVIPRLGLGVALKIEDGHKRAAQIALGATLRHLGVLDDEHAEALQDYLRPNLSNSRGDVIGYAEPSSIWKH